MTLSLEHRILSRLEDGLPLSSRPYLEMSEDVGCTESELIDVIEKFQSNGLIRRFGVVVKHRSLGYQSNAMVVWNVPDDKVDEVGQALANQQEVSLCYQRTRVENHWPYNLFTMIHGKERQQVVKTIDQFREQLNLSYDYDILFSQHCFSQHGARYFTANPKQNVEFHDA